MAKNGTDGVYDADPNIYPDAIKYKELTYMEMLEKNLKVIDATAAALCMDNDIDLVVFDMNEPDNIKKAVLAQVEGTIIKKEI